MKIFLIIIGLIAVLAFFAYRFWLPALPFSPDKAVGTTPAALGLPYEDVRLTTADGETLAGWYIPAAKADAAGAKAAPSGQAFTLLFFHGNAGNISHRLASIAIFHQLGLPVFIIDYRGFGASTGSPSVNGALLDAEAAWAWLLENKGLTPEQILIFGRSLGGGVAAAQAAKVRPAGLILESTFTSLYDVIKDMYPRLPVGLFLPQDFDTPATLKDLRVPLLVAHSPDDGVVPYRLGLMVYETYAGPKQFLELHGSHNEGFLQSKDAYMTGLRRFLTNIPHPAEPQK